jgi:hypothetical protein
VAVTIRVTQRGPSLDSLVAATVRDLRTANRTAGREIAKVGKKAIRAQAPKVGGKKLGATTRTRAHVDRAEVTFRANTVGGWMMHEKGTKPHPIRPKAGRRGRSNRRPALKLGRFAAHVNHPGTSGTGAWTKAVARLKTAIRPVVVDVYNDALGT